MKVRVRNYQTVKDTALEVKGFTVIVGKSNTGKTALLRAVEGSLFNDPVTGRVRHGEKDVQVTVDLPNLTWEWKKGETANDYTVTTDKGTQAYSRVGFQVPQEIVDRGFREWRVDGDNIRPQVAAWYSPIFLLDKSGKAATELMTTVTRMDVINLAIRKCSTLLRKNNSTLKVREEDLAKADRRARDFEVLDRIDTDQLLSDYREYLDLDLESSSIAGYLKDLDELKSSVAGYQILDDVRVPPLIGPDLPNALTRLDVYLSKLGTLHHGLVASSACQAIQVPPPVDRHLVDSLSHLEGWAVRLEALSNKLTSLKLLDGLMVPQAVSATDLQSKRGLVEGWCAKLQGLSAALSALSTAGAIEVPAHDIEPYYNALQKVLEYESELESLTSKLAILDQDLLTTKEGCAQDQERLVELRGELVVCPVCGRE